MDELVQRVVVAAGLEPDTARKAIGMVLHFLQKESPPVVGAAVLDKIPGGRAAAAAVASEEDGLSGMPGAGLMGLAGELGSAGLGMADMQVLGREMFAYMREHAGEGAVGALAASIPGLGQFI